MVIGPKQSEHNDNAKKNTKENVFRRLIASYKRKKYNKSGLIQTQVLISKKDHSPLLFTNPDVIRYSIIELLLREVLDHEVPGELAELGVYQGVTSKFINSIAPGKKLYLFDTFEGFDTRDIKIQYDKYGDSQSENRFADTSTRSVLEIMSNPESCIVKKGYFPDSLDGLEETFCFVSLDCDLYSPTLEGLRYFYPRLSKGGYIIIHDYNNVEFEKGIKQAVDEYCKTNCIPVVPISDAWGSVVIAK